MYIVKIHATCRPGVFVVLLTTDVLDSVAFAFWSISLCVSAFVGAALSVGC